MKRIAVIGWLGRFGALAAVAMALAGAHPAAAQWAARDAADKGIYFSASGAGTFGSPYLPNFAMSSSSSGASVTAAGKLILPATQTITRPGTTPTYATGQIVCGASSPPCAPLSWTVTSVPGGPVRLTKVSVTKGSPGTTGASFRLWFSSAAPTLTATTDATAYSPLLVDRAFRQGFADCTSPIGNSDNVSYQCLFPNGTFLDAATDASGKIYGFLQAQGAYPGVSGETLYIDLVGQPMGSGVVN